MIPGMLTLCMQLLRARWNDSRDVDSGMQLLRARWNDSRDVDSGMQLLRACWNDSRDVDTLHAAAQSALE